MNVPVIVSARLGFGRDMWGIKPRNITESLKWLYVAYFMYMLAECLCQLSHYGRTQIANNGVGLHWPGNWLRDWQRHCHDLPVHPDRRYYHQHFRETN
jgi:hypothetical protein